MTMKYVISFDDSKGNFKRLLQFNFNTSTSYFSFNDSKVRIGSSISSYSPYFSIRDDDSTNHFFISAYSNSNSPNFSFQRRRNSGVAVQNGDILGSIRFETKTSLLEQFSTQILAEYMGTGGASNLTRILFKTSNANAAFIDSDKGLGLYASASDMYFVKLKSPSLSSSYTLTLPNSLGTTGQLLSTDSSGNLSWSDKFVYITSTDPTVDAVNAPAGTMVVWAGSTGSKFYWKRDSGATTNVAPADESALSSSANGDWGWVTRGNPSFTNNTSFARMTLASSAYIMVGGRQVFLPSGNYDVTPSGVAGQRYAYFDDASKTLKLSLTPWDFFAVIPAFTCHWNGSSIDAIGYEMHGMRDLQWHYNEHKYKGSQYDSGLTATGNVQTDNNVNPSSLTVEYLWFTPGIIADEDNKIQVGSGLWTQNLGSGLTSDTAATLNFWYFNGISVVKQNAMIDNTPFIHLGGNTTPMWNNDGSLTAATTGQYVVYYYYASVLIGGDCLFARPSNAIYSSLSAAQAASPNSLIWSGFPADDIKYIYKAIFRVNTGWNGSTHRSKLVALDDFRLTAGTPIAAMNANSHNALSGRDSPNCHPTSAITNFETEVNSLISSYFELSEFNFDVDNDGQTDFDLGIDVTGKRIEFYQNGVKKRKGSSFDWVVSGSIITTTYTVKNSWILITVS